MADYQFTEKAKHDLESIIDFTVQQWGVHQAHGYIDGLEDQCQLLADNPKLGVQREEIHDSLLSFPYQSHVLYYINDPHGITIVRVLHHSMDPYKHL